MSGKVSHGATLGTKGNARNRSHQSRHFSAQTQSIPQPGELKPQVSVKHSSKMGKIAQTHITRAFTGNIVTPELQCFTVKCVFGP